MRITKYIIAVAMALTATSCIMVEGDEGLREPKWVGRSIAHATMTDATAVAYYIRLMLEYDHALMLDEGEARQSLLYHIHVGTEVKEQDKYTILIVPLHPQYELHDTIEIATTGGALSEGATWRVSGPVELTIEPSTEAGSDYIFTFDHISNSHLYQYVHNTHDIRGGCATVRVNDLTKGDYTAYADFDFVGEMRFIDINHSKDKPLYLNTEIVEPLTYVCRSSASGYEKGCLETTCTDTYYDTVDEVAIQINEHTEWRGTQYVYYAGSRDHLKTKYTLI